MAYDTFNSDSFRSHFPHLKDLVHLASCSQGALSREVHYALSDMTRSLHLFGAPWGEWMAEVEEARALFAELINTTPDHVAVVPTASAGAYQVASSFNWTGASLVTSDLEFPSVGQVFHAQQAHGARITFIDDREACLEADVWDRSYDDETKLVSVPLVSYHNGARPDVETIVSHARECGISTFVDAYQGAGVVPIDVQAIGCDYLVSGSLKFMLGLAGVAFLYVKDVEQAERLPEFTGWFGREDPFSFDARDASYSADARRFEGGTPSIPAIYGAVAGLRLLAGTDQVAGFAHVMQLREYFCAELNKLGVEVSQPDDKRRHGPQVAIRVGDPDALGQQLAEHGIVTAPRNDVVRMSLHYYNSMADIDTTIQVLRNSL